MLSHICTLIAVEFVLCLLFRWIYRRYVGQVGILPHGKISPSVGDHCYDLDRARLVIQRAYNLIIPTALIVVAAPVCLFCFYLKQPVAVIAAVLITTILILYINEDGQEDLTIRYERVYNHYDPFSFFSSNKQATKVSSKHKPRTSKHRPTSDRSKPARVL